MNTEYELKNDNSPVELTIHIGYGQFADTRLMFGTVQYGEMLKNDFSGVVIGDNKSLKDKSLSIYTIVHGVNTASNETSVEAKISGGVSDLIIPPIIQPVSSGGFVYYTINIDFY